MPLESVHATADTRWGYWRINEAEDSLSAEVPGEEISAAVTNPMKRLEFFAGRVLIKTLLKEWGISFPGVTKDAFGKPFLAESEIKVSLSHSYPYVAAVVHLHKNVGIDLEQPKSKLLRVAARVLAADELADAGDDIIKHCIYWCSKETLIKIHGKKDLIFSKNLRVSPFSIAPKGHLVGRILANNMQTTIPLEYIVTENFVVVVSN